jgi:hypothetical protein
MGNNDGNEMLRSTGEMSEKRSLSQIVLNDSEWRVMA